MKDIVNDKKNVQLDNNKLKEDELYQHLKNLHTISIYAYNREFKKLYSYIEDEYFHKKVFDDSFYKSANDFIFRMDVTYLCYGQVLNMAYRDLQKGDRYSFLLALKIILVKLKGNQRYTYYDRDEILNLLNNMKADYSFNNDVEKSSYVPEIFLDECKNYMPIGFQEMTFEEYYNGLTRSYFDSYAKIDEKILEKEFHIAFKEGSLYHYIVQFDHYINSKRTNVTDTEWIFLLKLLSAYYGTEKYPWSTDMTTDLLRAFLGIQDTCNQQEFKDILCNLVNGIIRIIIKKISSPEYNLSTKEIKEIVNFLINVYTLDNNKQYLIYISDFLKLAEKIEDKSDLSGINQWLEKHKKC